MTVSRAAEHPKQTDGTSSSLRKLICLVVTNDRVLVPGLRGLLVEASDIEFVQCDPDVVASLAADARPMADIALVDVQRSLAPQEGVIRALVGNAQVGPVGLVGRNFSRAVVQSARRLGVSVFVATSLSPDRLALALREAALGFHFGPGKHEHCSAEPTWLGRADGLTERESQVLAFVAAGLTNRQIADRLFVSVETVRTHVKRAYHRLGLRNRAQACTYVHQVTNPEVQRRTSAATTLRPNGTVDVVDLDKFDSLLLSVGATAWEMGPHHLRIVGISDGHIGLTAVAASDRLGQRAFSRFFPGDDGVRFVEMFAKLRVGESAAFDHKIVLPGGKTRNVRTTLVVSGIRDGAVVVSGVTIDVTGSANRVDVGSDTGSRTEPRQTSRYFWKSEGHPMS